MLTEDVSVCDYVDRQGVKEVWIWGYHYGLIEPTESNLQMGTISSAYWNHGTYGDISNSEQTNDLPQCSKTYAVYNYNYGRETEQAVHNHGHHLERILGWVDNSLFWDGFVGGRTRGTSSGWVIDWENRGCGWTHHAPQTAPGNDYGLNAAGSELSDCKDWKPDRSGVKNSISCDNWSCLELEYYRWWMQNMPGKDNNLIYNGNPVRNWWDFTADFDAALTPPQGKSLTS